MGIGSQNNWEDGESKSQALRSQEEEVGGGKPRFLHHVEPGILVHVEFAGQTFVTERR